MGAAGLLLLAGLVLLIAGAEFMIRAAVSVAGMLKISPLIIGLTIVAFGTSAPELAITVYSSLTGRSTVGLGNVLGSNIFNVLFILGASALIRPLSVAVQLVRFDVPLMVAVSGGTMLLCIDGNVSRLDGAILVGGLAAYLLRCAHQGSKSATVDLSEFNEVAAVEFTWLRLMLQAAVFSGGLVALTIGTSWFTSGGVQIAKMFGVSDLIIGLTIISVGTSLPEVATSLMAAARGQRDIAVGNVVGSNLFNLLSVLGVAGLLTPDGIAVPREAIHFDFPVMVAVAVACLPVFFTGHEISRWEGATFLAYYFVYVVYVVLDATEHDALNTYVFVLKTFVIPLTVLTFAVIWGGSYRRKVAARKQIETTAEPKA